MGDLGTSFGLGPEYVLDWRCGPLRGPDVGVGKVTFLQVITVFPCMFAVQFEIMQASYLMVLYKSKCWHTKSCSFESNLQSSAK